MPKKTQKTVVGGFSVFEKMGEAIFFLEKPRFDFTRWGVTHIWALAFGPLLILLLNDVIVGAISPTRQVLSELLIDLSDVYFISLSVLVLIGGLIFRHLLRQTPRTFLELAKNGLLEENPQMPPQKNSPRGMAGFFQRLFGNPSKSAENHRTFSSQFRANVTSRGRWIITVAILLLGPPLILYADGYKSLGLFSSLPNLFNSETASWTLFLDTLWRYTRWVFAPVLWVFAFAPGIWILYTIGAAIKDLTPRFILALQPSHPDGCGGLRRLGDVCFNMALPLIIAILLTGAWTIIGLRTDPGAPVTLVSIIGLILLIVISIVVFLAPLWDIHREMLARRTQYQDDLAERIDQTERELRENFRSGKTGTAESLSKELKALQELHPTARNYPTWPFDSRIFLKVISPSTLSVLGVIFSLDKETRESLSAVLQPLLDLIGQGK